MPLAVPHTVPAAAERRLCAPQAAQGSSPLLGPSRTGSGPDLGLCRQSNTGHMLLPFCASVYPTVNGDVETLAWCFCHSGHPSCCSMPHPFAHPILQME